VHSEIWYAWGGRLGAGRHLDINTWLRGLSLGRSERDLRLEDGSANLR
jgi:hypothetical protein